MTHWSTSFCVSSDRWGIPAFCNQHHWRGPGVRESWVRYAFVLLSQTFGEIQIAARQFYDWSDQLIWGIRFKKFGNVMQQICNQQYLWCMPGSGNSVLLVATYHEPTLWTDLQRGNPTKIRLTIRTIIFWYVSRRGNGFQSTLMYSSVKYHQRRLIHQ